AFFVNEMVDVFAWLMAVASDIENVTETRPSLLNQEFEKAFLEGCPECQSALCKCAPILPEKIGRLSKEIPLDEYAGWQGFVLSRTDYLRVFGGRMDLPDETERLNRIKEQLP